MYPNNSGINGLTNEEVVASREKNGSNALIYKKEYPIWNAIRSLLKEPMVLLLLVASVIYFISGKTGDGIFLAAAIVLVAAISLYQDSRSRNALEKLKTFTQPTCKVIRNKRPTAFRQLPTERTDRSFDRLVTRSAANFSVDG